MRAFTREKPRLVLELAITRDGLLSDDDSNNDPRVMGLWVFRAAHCSHAALITILAEESIGRPTSGEPEITGHGLWPRFLRSR